MYPLQGAFFMNTVDVSVVVTTRNEERHIAACLESVRRQKTFPREHIEIIVVDNHSTDGTVGIARRMADAVYSHGPERSSQRNFGVEKSRGKYALVLDADMTLSDGVVRECCDLCEHEGHIALFIPERVTGTGFWIRVRDFERVFYNATCIDAVRFINREVFLKSGGYDLSLTGPEDWDLDRRLAGAGTFGIVSSPLFHNEGAFSLGSYLQKKAYYAGNFDAYAAKWGTHDPVIRKQLGFRYRYYGVFIEHGKWTRLIRHPVLTLGMYALRFMVGVLYLARVKHNGS